MSTYENFDEAAAHQQLQQQQPEEGPHTQQTYQTDIPDPAYSSAPYQSSSVYQPGPPYQTGPPYQSGAVGYEHASSIGYPNYATPHADEEFSVSSPKFVLRVVEVIFALICFAVMASVPGFDNKVSIEQAQQMVMIGASAFVYLILITICDFMRAKQRYFGNLDLVEFAFDFLFTVLAFCGALSLAVKCNKTLPGSNVKFCDYYTSGSGVQDPSDHTNYNKSGASAACGFLLSFCMIASTFLDYRSIIHSRNS